MVVIDRKQITSGIIGLCMGVMIGVGIMVLRNRTLPAPIVIHPPEPTPLPAPTATPGPIRVFVNGQVAAPAVYTLPPDSLVEAAITAAGGFTSEASTAVVNLAQPLQDGMQVYVPSQQEAAQPVAVVMEATPLAADPVVGAAAGSDLVNINTADLDTLDTLPGIGPSIAQNIIDHRDANGPFGTKEAIMDVSGIGEAKFEQIRELITIGEE